VGWLRAGSQIGNLTPRCPQAPVKVTVCPTVEGFGEEVKAGVLVA